MNGTMNEEMHPRLNFWGCGSGLWGRPLVNESAATAPPANTPRRRRRAASPAGPAMLPVATSFSRNGFLYMNFFGTGQWRAEEELGVGARP